MKLKAFHWTFEEKQQKNTEKAKCDKRLFYMRF